MCMATVHEVPCNIELKTFEDWADRCLMLEYENAKWFVVFLAQIKQYFRCYGGKRERGHAEIAGDM